MPGKHFLGSKSDWLRGKQQMATYQWGAQTNATTNNYITFTTNDVTTGTLQVQVDNGTPLTIGANAQWNVQTDAVRYAPPPLEFNRYVNASDMLEEFIRYVGAVGVRQSEVLDLPLSLLVNWLVIEAAKADGEPEPGDVHVFPQRLKCTACGRFVSPRRVRFPFCDARHFQRAITARAA